MNSLKPIKRFSGFVDNWKISTLKHCCSKITDGTHDTPKQVSKGFPFITAIHVKESGIDFNNCYYLPEDVHRTIYNRCNPEYGDVLIVNIGAGVATSAFVNVEYEFSLKYVALLKPNRSILNGRFLNYYQIFSKKDITSKFLNGGAQSFLSLKDLSSIKINLPSLEEQTKIATFLSAVDSKITSLERLVTHWQAYKKGIMQQIFTQQLRFKAPNGEDFPEWETKTLGEIGSTYNGLSGKTKDDFGSGFPYITYKSVFDNSRVDINRVEYVKVFISSNVEDKSEKQNKVEYGDIFFTVSSETPTEVGMSSVLLDEIDNCYLNSFCFGYRLNDKVSFNPKFFQHYLRSSEMRKCISILAQGSTRYNISASNMMNLEIIVPSSEEQTKIATFLSSLDDKIAHLQQQLTSYRQFKKALLQQMFV